MKITLDEQITIESKDPNKDGTVSRFVSISVSGLNEDTKKIDEVTVTVDPKALIKALFIFTPDLDIDDE